MLISQDKKFIFIANTKTASTSIESILSKYSNISLLTPPIIKHMPYKMVVKRFNFLFSANDKFHVNKYYKFGVFRDPIDWIISWFNYRSRPEISNPNSKFSSNYVGNISFEEFVDNIMPQAFKPQRYKFVNNNDKNAMDFIIRYENLEAELKQVLEELDLNLDISFPYKNKSENIRIKKEDLSNKLIGKIKDYYLEDYKFIEKCKNS